MLCPARDLLQPSGRGRTGGMLEADDCRAELSQGHSRAVTQEAEGRSAMWHPQRKVIALLGACLVSSCAKVTPRAAGSAGDAGGAGPSDGPPPADNSGATNQEMGPRTEADAGRTLACSGDLRSVTNDSGLVVATCGPDEGCTGGKCVRACDAAAASRGNVGCDYLVPTPVVDKG